MELRFHGKRHAATWKAAATLLGLLILWAFPLSTLCMVVALHHDIPWGDDISLLAAMRPEKGLSWQRLFQFHNEHQIVFTKLTVFADYATLRGRYVLTAAMAVLLAWWVPLVYCRSFRLLGGAHPACDRWAWTAGLLCAVYMNGNLLWALTTPILLQHLFVAAFATTAAYAFSLAAPIDEAPNGVNRRAWALFFALSGLAALAGANGLLILPAALLVAVAFFTDWKAVRRAAPWRLIAALAAVALAVGVVYYSAYRHSSGSPSQGVPWANLVKFAVFFTGGPFWRESTWPVESHPSPSLVLTTCAAFCGLLIWLVVDRLRQRETVSRFDLFQVFMIVFVILTAAAGAWSRVEFGAAEGLNKKYPATSLLAWLAAASLILGRRPKVFLGREGGGTARPILVSVAAAALILPAHVGEFHAWRHWRDQLQEAAAMTASGVYDEIRLKRLYFDPEVPFRLALEVWRPHGVYFIREWPAPPYNAASRFEIDRNGDLLTSRIVHVERASQRSNFTGWLVWGELVGTRESLQGRPLVFVDSSGSVAGYGYISEEMTQGASAHWFGAFRGTDGNGVKVYVREGKRLRKMASVTPPPGASPTPALTLVDEVLDHRDYSLERFNEVVTPLAKPPVRVAAGGRLVLSGWAVDRYAQKPAAGVEVEIDGDVYPCVYGRKREDVAQYFQQPAYKNSGFLLDLAAAQVGPGWHELRVRVLSADGKTYRRSVPFRFEVK